MKSSNKLKIFVYFILLVSLVVYLTIKEKNYYIIPTFASENIVNAVVEIPAGTNKKIEYNTKTNEFQVNQFDGQDRIIEFLPYPFNYGFIPSTLMDEERGGDGDALDIIILSESLPTSTVVKVIPIGMIQLIDNKEIDTKIVAIPENDELRIIDALSLEEIQENYPAVIEIIKQWFLHYKGDKVIEINSWSSKEKAMLEIKKWQK